MGVYSAAIAYQKLLDYEYHLVVVKNRNTEPIEIKLHFDKVCFHHLCGLHKLRGLTIIRREQRETVFDNIIEGVYPEDIFESNPNYNLISDRIACLEALEQILDDDNTVFKFNKAVNKHSAIEADYIIKNETIDLRRYYFISESENIKGQFFGRSCFSRKATEPDYTKGHTTYKILKKTKVKISTGEKTDLYISPSYKQSALAAIN